MIRTEHILKKTERNETAFSFGNGAEQFPDYSSFRLSAIPHFFISDGTGRNNIFVLTTEVKDTLTNSNGPVSAAGPFRSVAKNFRRKRNTVNSSWTDQFRFVFEITKNGALPIAVPVHVGSILKSDEAEHWQLLFRSVPLPPLLFESTNAELLHLMFRFTTNENWTELNNSNGTELNRNRNFKEYCNTFERNGR